MHNCHISAFIVLHILQLVWQFRRFDIYKKNLKNFMLLWSSTSFSKYHEEHYYYDSIYSNVFFSATYSLRKNHQEAVAVGIVCCFYWTFLSTDIRDRNMQFEIIIYLPILATAHNNLNFMLVAVAYIELLNAFEISKRVDCFDTSQPQFCLAPWSTNL